MPPSSNTSISTILEDLNGLHETINQLTLVMQGQLNALAQQIQNEISSGGPGQVYAPLISPILTGVPIAPTAAPLTDTGQIATTEFVTTAIAGSSSSLTLTQVIAMAIALG